MPREFLQVNPVAEVSAESLGRLVADVNGVLADLTLRLTELESRDGFTATFAGPVNFNGQPIQNAAQTHLDSEVPGRRELTHRSLFSRGLREPLRTRRPIDAAAGVVTPDALLGREAVSLGQLQASLRIAQAAITSLTDNSGGTANDTVQALPDPVDAPVTVDALRDDLVANLIPALRDNFADLAAKANAILSALRGYPVIST